MVADSGIELRFNYQLWPQLNPVLILGLSSMILGNFVHVTARKKVQARAITNLA